jgi:deoxyribonucleoside regulator
VSGSSNNGWLLLKVCHQYYRLGLSQTEIADRLNLSRFQVARLLRAAVEEGYVTVKILEPEPWHVDLERELEERYGLKTVIVVDNDGLEEAEIKRRVADAAGRYLVETLENGDVLGVSLGSTIQDLVDQLPDRIPKHVDVVQLIGGSPGSQSSLSPSILTADLARRFRSRPYLLYAPAVVENGDLRQALLADSTIKGTYAMYDRLSVAVLGIGALSHGTSSRLLYGGIIDDTLLHTLLHDGAVGDVLSHVFREDGSLVRSVLDECMVAIDFSDLQRVPRRIGVAAGPAKTRAIVGALQGGLINVLVTDSVVARELITITEPQAARVGDEIEGDGVAVL